MNVAEHKKLRERDLSASEGLAQMQKQPAMQGQDHIRETIDRLFGDGELLGFSHGLLNDVEI